ncbi:hypothetical protein ENUP19_0013G0033 [Entamoeba nuttalli]|uniref:Cornichon protein n=2 Tax=Entamoeba nuttalli TaxID=412467 RepID=K2GEP3_ENTNP|nr:hypothetical protein ENU1_068660 [Entamoeba nuttalli P19]EKE41081.1 hypothetical protein ENU1_068660 [Entamoeba nuttalli P19]|eukprot:XP_008856588.1 hypothetical protein ENU1_068660 [Entamoeba nuttalli P19]
MEDFYHIIFIVTAFILNAINLGINYHFVISGEEFKSQSISPVDYCNEINPFIRLEIIINVLNLICYIIPGDYIEIVLCLCIFIYFSYLYYKKFLFIKPINAQSYLERNESVGYQKIVYYLLLILILLTRLILIYLTNFEVNIF